jgi:hypothetical protein
MLMRGYPLNGMKNVPMTGYGADDHEKLNMELKKNR